jgi:hypothetical protein
MVMYEIPLRPNSIKVKHSITQYVVNQQSAYCRRNTKMCFDDQRNS